MQNTLMVSQITCSTSKTVPRSTYKRFKQLRDMAEGENWMTRVMISRTWNELDFLGTNEVQSLDLLMIDENELKTLERSESPQKMLNSPSSCYRLDRPEGESGLANGNI
ncbi:hypothetical protein C5167_035379 [Papaver somniferum]|uniref:Uncharacterized protein n=1 Tax=Papaver somniferum TaxID=3469 RepID=A0A4Y7KII0_PAPSO|nr:hypothetical protein C5167_035379 [Papaver somniferum]